MKPPVYNPEWPDEIKSLYNHDIQEIWDSSIALHIWNQYHNQLETYQVFADSQTPLKILDVGCAQATLALKLAELGHQVWAMDIRQGFLDYAAARYEFGVIHFVCGNVLEVPLSETFDLIFANQIVEHLVYPQELIEKLVLYLNPGGRLVMTTPNCAYLKNDLPCFSDLGDPKDHEQRQFTADADGHFYAYYAEELIDLFEKAGLSRVECSTFETPFISGHMKVRYVHSVVPYQLLKALDRLLLRIPCFGKKLSHQLLVTGCVR